MKRIYQALGLLALAVLLAACSKTDPPQQKFSAVDITGVPWGKDFHLTDHNGQARSVADFKRKAVVLFFGYTNCPDMCPMTMYKLATAVQKLGKDGERVQVLLWRQPQPAGLAGTAGGAFRADRGCHHGQARDGGRML